MYLKGKGFFYRKRKKPYWKTVRYKKGKSPYNTKSWKYNGKLIKL